MYKTVYYVLKYDNSTITKLEDEKSLTGGVKIQKELKMTEMSRNHRNEHDIAVIEHSSEEENRHLEASGLCLVNRGFTLPWLHTPLTPPPVEHKVNVIPSDSSHIYSEIGTVIGRREQSESLPVTDSEFENISLDSHSESNVSVSTAYRACTEHVHSGQCTKYYQTIDKPFYERN